MYLNVKVNMIFEVSRMKSTDRYLSLCPSMWYISSATLHRTYVSYTKDLSITDNKCVSGEFYSSFLNYLMLQPLLSSAKLVLLFDFNQLHCLSVPNH